MNAKDLEVGDEVKIKNSITGNIIKITKNGWFKVAWMFVNDGTFTGTPDREMQINGFRAKDVECVLSKKGVVTS
jgi:hypothetical protein